MPDFANGAAVARTQLLNDLEVFGSQIQLVLDSNLQLLISARILAPRVEVVSVGFGGWWGSRGGGFEGKAFDIFALHGARSKGIGHDYVG